MVGPAVAARWAAVALVCARRCSSRVVLQGPEELEAALDGVDPSSEGEEFAWSTTWDYVGSGAAANECMALIGCKALESKLFW